MIDCWEQSFSTIAAKLPMVVQYRSFISSSSIGSKRERMPDAVKNESKEKTIFLTSFLAKQISENENGLLG